MARDLEGFDLDVGRGGEGVGSGEDTSASDSSDAGVGERDGIGTGSDFRVFLAGEGLVSRATLLRLAFRLLGAGASGEGEGVT